MEQIRGVNLGNWLVLEKWMSPSMFEGTDAKDEYYLARQLPADIYRERIRRHREEYITEHDFARLSQLGINTVRIPIPFSIFGDRAPYIGCIEELDHAFDWAEKWKLKVLIDLHTVPGSQNGFDNGGICGICKWSGMPNEVDFTLKLLEKLAVRYGKREGLLGIEPLNEPITDVLLRGMTWDEAWIKSTYPPKDPELAKGSEAIPMDFLRQFYTNAYKRVITHMAPDKYFVIHDAFCTRTWKDFMQEEEFRNVMLDTHFYLSNAEVGGCEKTLEGYTNVLREHFRELMKEMSQYFLIICGEWCIDNSYVKTLENTKERDMVFKTLAREQLDTWDVGNGSIYWNYKLLAMDETLDCWDFGKCVAHGWFPTDAEDADRNPHKGGYK